MENSQALNVLVKMVNQIAANISPNKSQQQIAKETADHLMRFWAKSMKQQIIDSLEIKNNQLQPAAVEAIILLKQVYTNKT